MNLVGVDRGKLTSIRYIYGGTFKNGELPNTVFYNDMGKTRATKPNPHMLSFDFLEVINRIRKEDGEKLLDKLPILIDPKFDLTNGIIF